MDNDMKLDLEQTELSAAKAKIDQLETLNKNRNDSYDVANQNSKLPKNLSYKDRFNISDYNSHSNESTQDFRNQGKTFQSHTNIPKINLEKIKSEIEGQYHSIHLSNYSHRDRNPDLEQTTGRQSYPTPRDKAIQAESNNKSYQFIGKEFCYQDFTERPSGFRDTNNEKNIGPNFQFGQNSKNDNQRIKKAIKENRRLDTMPMGEKSMWKKPEWRENDPKKWVTKNDFDQVNNHDIYGDKAKLYNKEIASMNEFWKYYNGNNMVITDNGEILLEDVGVAQQEDQPYDFYSEAHLAKDFYRKREKSLDVNRYKPFDHYAKSNYLGRKDHVTDSQRRSSVQEYLESKRQTKDNKVDDGNLIRKEVKEMGKYKSECKLPLHKKKIEKDQESNKSSSGSSDSKKHLGSFKSKWDKNLDKISEKSVKEEDFVSSRMIKLPSGRITFDYQQKKDFQNKIKEQFNTKTYLKKKSDKANNILAKKKKSIIKVKFEDNKWDITPNSIFIGNKYNYPSRPSEFSLVRDRSLSNAEKVSVFEKNNSNRNSFKSNRKISNKKLMDFNTNNSDRVTKLSTGNVLQVLNNVSSNIYRKHSGMAYLTSKVQEKFENELLGNFPQPGFYSTKFKQMEKSGDLMDTDKNTGNYTDRIDRDSGIKPIQKFPRMGTAIDKMKDLAVKINFNSHHRSQPNIAYPRKSSKKYSNVGSGLGDIYQKKVEFDNPQDVNAESPVMFRTEPNPKKGLVIDKQVESYFH